MDSDNYEKMIKWMMKYHKTQEIYEKCQGKTPIEFNSTNSNTISGDYNN